MVVRRLLLKYASTLGKVFRHQGVASLKLCDVAFETFEIFLGWLEQEYERQYLSGIYSPIVVFPIYSKTDYQNPTDDPLIWEYDRKSADTTKYVEPVINVFVFAEAYMIPRLRQDAIDRLVWCTNSSTDAHFVPASVIQRVYKHTPASSPLHRLLAIRYCLSRSKGQVNMHEFSKQLLVDIIDCQRLHWS